MQRVALVAPDAVRRDALVLLADSGEVELDHGDGDGDGGPAARQLHRLPGTPPAPVLSPVLPDLPALAADGRADLLAGEAELEERATAAAREGEVDALLGLVTRPLASARRGGVPGTGTAEGFRLAHPGVLALPPGRDPPWVRGRELTGMGPGPGSSAARPTALC
jgi:V/A-type H+-transporting ATPase subunit I